MAQQRQPHSIARSIMRALGILVAASLIVAGLYGWVTRDEYAISGAIMRLGLPAVVIYLFSSLWSDLEG